MSTHVSEERTTFDAQLVWRRARKTKTCRGNGASRAYRKYAPGHVTKIRPGDIYLDCLWESDPYHSDTPHCEACGQPFFTERSAGPSGGKGRP